MCPIFVSSVDKFGERYSCNNVRPEFKSNDLINFLILLLLYEKKSVPISFRLLKLYFSLNVQEETQILMYFVRVTFKFLCRKKNDVHIFLRKFNSGTFI